MAGTWTVFTSAKKRLGLAEFNLSTVGAYLTTLHLSGSTLLSEGTDVSTLASVSALQAQLASAFNYVRGGQTLSSNEWSASGNVLKFSAAGLCWSANGGGFAALKTAVIHLSTAAKSGTPLAYMTLSSDGTKISVADGSALKINGGRASGAKLLTLT
jgi:hypothetical protein